MCRWQGVEKRIDIESGIRRGESEEKAPREQTRRRAAGREEKNLQREERDREIGAKTELVNIHGSVVRKKRAARVRGTEVRIEKIAEILASEVKIKKIARGRENAAPT
jgi:hypothetical protein